MPKRNTPLPAAMDAHVGSREGAGEGTGTRTPRVLIADDEEDMRVSLRYALEDAGYEVVEASDGVSTLDMLMMSATPLVVLLDLIMPRMSGYEVLRCIVADSHLLAFHAYCVMTAEPAASKRVGPHLAEMVERHGFTMVPKPFDLGELLDCVAHEWQRLAGNESEGDAHACPA